MFYSSESISQDICNFPAPILFIDTCIFLDILRSPYRNNIPIDTISSALNLIKMSESKPREVWLLTNETVYGEWNDNIANVKKELKSEIKNIEDKREKLVTAADVILKINHIHGQRITSLDLHERLGDLSHIFLKSSLKIELDDNHSVKAMYRVRKCLAPAQKGKPSPKDCEIFESFLDISERVRKMGYNDKICFLTSNHDDYGKPKNPLIAEELEKIDAKLINNLQWALTVASK